MIEFIDLNGEKDTKRWSLEDIRYKRKIFKSEMKSSIIEKRRIAAKVLLFVTPLYSLYL